MPVSGTERLKCTWSWCVAPSVKGISHMCSSDVVTFSPSINLQHVTSATACNRLLQRSSVSLVNNSSVTTTASWTILVYQILRKLDMKNTTFVYPLAPSRHSALTVQKLIFSKVHSCWQTVLRDEIRLMFSRMRNCRSLSARLWTYRTISQYMHHWQPNSVSYKHIPPPADQQRFRSRYQNSAWDNHSLCSSVAVLNTVLKLGRAANTSFCRIWN